MGKFICAQGILISSIVWLERLFPTGCWRTFVQQRQHIIYIKIRLAHFCRTASNYISKVSIYFNLYQDPHFRTTASTYISKVSIYSNIYQDTAGALWYNSFNIKGSSRPSAPGPLCTSVDGLRSMACDQIKWGEKWTTNKIEEKNRDKIFGPPLVRECGDT